MKSKAAAMPQIAQQDVDASRLKSKQLLAKADRKLAEAARAAEALRRATKLYAARQNPKNGEVTGK